MIRELLSHAHIGLPLIAMGLFITVFFAIVARTYGRKAASYTAEERLPLEGESDHLTDGGRRG